MFRTKCSSRKPAGVPQISDRNGRAPRCDTCKFRWRPSRGDLDSGEKPTRQCPSQAKTTTSDRTSDDPTMAESTPLAAIRPLPLDNTD
uniref:GATA-type domain-containing protein n=1 Tax=Caenorhabditis japonica TaxID=281687 RepID=A0A8R1ERQ3_CAEJA